MIFIGVEGQSERAFAQFLQRCCNEAGLHMHLNIKLGSGGDSAQAAAAKRKLEIIFQDPNLEGLLLRLHGGSEQRMVTPRAALTELRRVWPEYNKPPTADG